MYIKFLPNEYVLHYRKGKLIESGEGLSFYFIHKSTAAAVIPVSGMDADFIYQVKTADFQSVTVQGQLAYRIVDCDRIANLMNFTVDLKTKAYYDDPLKKLSKRIINIADVMVKRRIEMIDLKTAVRSNHKLAGEILDEFGGLNELNALGVQVTGFSILNISDLYHSACTWDFFQINCSFKFFLLRKFKNSTSFQIFKYHIRNCFCQAICCYLNIIKY